MRFKKDKRRKRDFDPNRTLITSSVPYTQFTVELRKDSLKFFLNKDYSIEFQLLSFAIIFQSLEFFVPL
jgi:hypothetical protein